MWVTGAILAVAAVIIYLEVPRLAKDKLKKRDVVLFFILLIAGACLSIALGMNAPVPNPIDWLAFVFGPMTVKLLGR